MELEYKPLKGRAAWATLLLATLGVISIAFIISTIAEINLLRQIESGQFITEAQATANDTRQAAIGGLYLAAYIAAVVGFLAWMYRAHKNLDALGYDSRFYPRDTIIWWFIPIANLFRPYQVMKEIWKGSHPDLGHASLELYASSSPLLPVWWALWIVSSFIGNRLFFALFSQPTVSDLIRNDILSIVADSISLTALGLALILMWRITRNQVRKAAIKTETVTPA